MAEKIVQNKGDCVHHWIIAPAAGEHSKGKCKKCKIVKDFSNSSLTNTSLYSWGNSTSKNNQGLRIKE